ncbi:hypothetical protein CVT24_010559 [Panaeolus cyanescens]|uniref:RING-type domain-containing protein n=1 Tax=Panaeolus cyanescens TaxID=181874 RepID=A0A409YYR5_9AGAR|nr:hypothetical protein CVT24_010559 [Panaeolus cyanescens]
MSTARYHPQHPLPAPVVHQAFSIPQSKSHVLAGVQDAYWSDDENEDAECPLCLEEMDISDLNFKPCVCGYQICRFCWHHIKENLNKRCPACRRVYTDDTVEFKPIATQDHKRLTQQKKQRERERKDLEALGRRHLANVRVVQRNVVYIVGIGPRFAKEELIPTLRSNEYFGQYGKITKILLVKRNQPGGSAPIVGLYITYHRREDAARAIAAVDGTPSPGGSRDIMRASYGTTKYCMAFLRGVPCNDHSCMNLHEWGDEKDCFTKEDLTTLKHTMKATESRARTTTTTTKKGDEDGMLTPLFMKFKFNIMPLNLAGLPRAASWAQKLPVGQSSNGLSSPSSSITVPVSSLPPGRQHRRGATSARQIRTVNGTTATSGTETRTSQTKLSSERKSASISRPETPAAADSGREGPSEPKPKAREAPSVPSSSPAPSTTTTSETAEATPQAVEQPEITEPIATPPAPTSVPQVPPGLSAPPGIPTPSRPPRAETASPQTPLLASQSSYQMSTAARALLDDVKARRESILSSSTSLSSPFPDFDRTLQTLSADDGGGFSFNFDPKLIDESNNNDVLPTFDMESMTPFKGSYVEAFPALRPPYGSGPSTPGGSIYDPSLAQQSGKPSSYMGSFNPFGPSTDDRISSAAQPLKGQYPSLDEERKVSRFGFARHRPNAAGSPSPHPISSLHSDSHHHSPLDEQHLHPWNSNLGGHHPESRLLPNSINQNQLHSISLLSQHQAMNAEISEAQLRNFIQSSQGDLNARGFNNAAHPVFPAQHFEDPAIMSASFIPSNNEPYFPPVSYGPPPGLPVPQSLASSHPSPLPQQHGIAEDSHQSGELLPHFFKGREACVPSAVLSVRNFYYRQ